MGRRPLVILAAVAIALPLAGAIAPASGLTSRGVSTPLGSDLHASQHAHHAQGLPASDAQLTRRQPVPRTAPRAPSTPVQSRHRVERPRKHRKHPKKGASPKPPTKHHKPPAGGAAPPHKKK